MLKAGVGAPWYFLGSGRRQFTALKDKDPVGRLREGAIDEFKGPTGVVWKRLASPPFSAADADPIVAVSSRSGIRAFVQGSLIFMRYVPAGNRNASNSPE